MSQDTIWQLIRYGLLALGGFFVGRGKLSADDLNTIVGAIGTVFPVVWGLYVKAGTKAVPAAVVNVPTVSAATGKVKV